MVYYRRISTLNPRLSVVSDTAKAYNNGKPQAIAKLHHDPRNIKDPEFQRNATRTITDYLAEAGYGFLDKRALRDLTSKEFQNIFKFLQVRIMPTYTYRGRFEDELTEVLKMLRYPLAETINIKAMYPIAALHTLPTIIALLSWMCEACIVTERIAEELNDTNHGFSDGRSDDRDDRTMTGLDDMEELFCDFTVASYHAFMEGVDNRSPIREELQRFFETGMAENKEHAERLREANQKLQQTLQHVEKRGSPLAVLKKRREELESDMKKFEVYCENKEQRIKKYSDLNARVHKESEALEQILYATQADVERLKQEVQRQNVSEEEFDQLEAQHEEFEKHYTNLQARIQELRKTQWEKEMSLEKERSMVDHIVSEYNQLAYRTGLVPADARNANGCDFTLSFTADALKIKDSSSIHMLNDALKHMQVLSERYKEWIIEDTTKMQRLQEEAHHVEEQVSETQMNIVMLKEKLTKRSAVLEETREKARQENIRYNEDMDAAEQRIKQMRSQAAAQVIESQQRESQLQVEIKETQSRIDMERQKMVEKIERLMNVDHAFSLLEQESRQLCLTLKQKYEKMPGIKY
ncbi:HEC/Ndc80p family-domain-containing protein [Radiomyces spectabilis]|uniref:HEC/Ndc80p family-domain-containing protein n=1 Tax=Radiomyces spectabilis TaxID=64574 RepID=UPI0022208B56|nr:HEC/Ndc80p family-domain-containing protein [Radiomyces spectabilis]KAI8384697.1 HEC/Ndc80p family-domain-containing protein [Radiomyces spectabilis]